MLELETITQKKIILNKLEKILNEVHDNNKKWFSSGLNHKLNNIHSRLYEPMRVAIVGQFSSGKSTFLNAILSNNILPTGIIPVTSKINYIKYGKDIRLAVSFKDGSEQFYDVSSIATFTDSRSKNETDSIDYLTLYYPLDLLKNIIFVDTPGLNSTSDADTETTKNILDNVDCIIWLTSAGNAAQKTEKDVVKEIINNYSAKSLCIINQKDQLDETDLADVISHVNEQFGQYFSKIEAISAKQALDARGSSTKNMSLEVIDKFIYSLTKELKAKIDTEDYNIKTLFEKQPQKLMKALEIVLNKDTSQNDSLLKESNITAVLNFINSDIRTQHKESKLFAINNEMKNVSHSMIEQNNIFISILDDLISVINQYDKFSSQEFNKYLNTEIKEANNRLQSDIEVIVKKSYSGIMEAWTPFSNTMKVIKKGIISDSMKTAIYKSAFIDFDKIDKYINSEEFQNLLNEYRLNIDKIKEVTAKKFMDIYSNLKDEISNWEERGLKKLKLINPLHSEKLFLEFKSNYLSKKIVLILNNFENHILESLKMIELNLRQLDTAMFWCYESAINATVGGINNNILRSEEDFEKYNYKFILPNKNDIMGYLDMYYDKETLLSMVSNENGFLSLSINHINSSHTEHVQSIMKDFKSIIKNNYTKENKKLQKFINSLNYPQEKS
jgi:predicted GTPase